MIREVPRPQTRAADLARRAYPLLSVRGLCKYFPGPSRRFGRGEASMIKAVDQVRFELYPGETLALVGESGSGKTTTARCILRAFRPNAGTIDFMLPSGRTVDLARLPDKELKPVRRHMQMVFQDPISSLNPRMTAGQIVAEPLVVHGEARGSELEDRVVGALRRVGIDPDHRRRYPHAFSGGQRQRIGIARALVLRPALIVCDEATSALDVSSQAQVLDLLTELQGALGLTYLFIAHNLDVVRDFSDRVAVMHQGRIVELAPTAQIFEDPRHPYTRALLSAMLSPGPEAFTGLDFDDKSGRALTANGSK
jgi:peptide/nickel transport system ATP-binding protein